MEEENANILFGENMELAKRIVILGDLMCSEDLVDSFKEKQFESLMGKDLLDILKSKEQLVTVNLEAPITASETIDKKGGSPNLKSNPVVVNFLLEIPNVLVSGANNHITDYGLDGIIDTEQILDSIGIPHIGFASNRESAGTYYRATVCTKLGLCELFSVAQNEFSTIVSDKRKYGAYGYDPLIIYDLIRSSKANQIIILFHAGKEYYQYPSPELVKICHKMIDCGAVAVICQHSHCIGCVETYKSGTVIYGTGNFLFNFNGYSDLSNAAIIPVASLGDYDITWSYIPIVKQGNGIRVANHEEKKDIMQGFFSRSEEIKTGGKIEELWRSYCDDNKYSLMANILTRNNRIFDALERRLGYPCTRRLLKNKRKNLVLLNYIRCEVIEEMIKTILIDLGDEG